MKYVCRICGYVYDDAREKIPFADLPDSWKCPVCGAGKADFQPAGGEGVPAPEKVPAAAALPAEPEPDGLSVGQLAALCSNLARGCEKQYRSQEAGYFRELAEYFGSVTPPVQDATVERVAERLQTDADGYAAVRATADGAGDRGAARVCVWGEKVTRMLLSLVRRYLEEGEAMLAGTQVWICSVCGFVYVGEKPPELCPVCKVPAWKFEKIEGRASA